MQVETGVVDMVRMELKYCERCGGLLVRRTGEPRVYCAICAQRMARGCVGTAVESKARTCRHRDAHAGSVVCRRKGAGMRGCVISFVAARQTGRVRTPAFADDLSPEMYLYRSRTTVLLRRYLRASVELGRVPSLLARIFPGAGYLLSYAQFRGCRDLHVRHGTVPERVG